MKEAEVLEKLSFYKDAILKLKAQRDEYKKKCEELTNGEQAQKSFMSELKTSLDEIDQLLEN